MYVAAHDDELTNRGFAGMRPRSRGLFRPTPRRTSKALKFLFKVVQQSTFLGHSCERGDSRVVYNACSRYVDDSLIALGVPHV